MVLLYLGSLVLGLVAWILPIVNLTRYKKQHDTNWAVLSIISISACAISLCFQIISIYYLVKMDDLPALMDTIGAVAFAAAVLLGVTSVLNTITLIVYRSRIVR
ncbi:hypothetical protein P5G51_016525 [Virgibacillus sp. 179-BFC.A HS]|uniref:Cytochrome c oxidase subunit 4 n=1 Tax=Tigheibacillus jepli TaxID=3035914 RepID=A0ABU5CKB5_9BACI|nr:hypothetical protein [Virgibacillus sp. 179-BFC.A HS]MDY0406749.1 hypothetical protein [Virgibacillus sp. 179-BFC.A HS]